MNTDGTNETLRHGISHVRGMVTGLEKRPDTVAGNPQWCVTLSTGDRFLVGEDSLVARHIHEQQFVESEHLFEVVSGLTIRRVVWSLKKPVTMSEAMQISAGTHMAGHILPPLTEREYVVRWEIELTATDPVSAAREALRIQQDPESIANYFDVFDVADEDEIPVDLDDIDNNGGKP